MGDLSWASTRLGFASSNRMTRIVRSRIRRLVYWSPSASYPSQYTRLGYLSWICILVAVGSVSA